MRISAFCSLLLRSCLGIWVQTLALRAKLCADIVAAAITTIPVASTNVISVITVSIAFPGWILTCPRTWRARQRWIKTLTSGAVLCHDSRATAVTTIPVTTTLVVVVVAVTITLPTWFGASPTTRAGLGTIEALASRAVSIVVGFSTAVAAIPIAASVVVPVIAISITFPLWLIAKTRRNVDTRVTALERAVQTLAVGAEVVLLFLRGRAATVAAVPTAARVVVSVVAKAVALPRAVLTRALNGVHTFVAHTCLRAI